MQDKKYLLSIQEFLREGIHGRLWKEAAGKVDAERCARAAQMKVDKAKAACLGAGLLLQLAVREAIEGRQDEVWNFHSVSTILERLPDAIPLSYKYGESGKPYLLKFPFYFNLSHSGDYVFCVLSAREIGADIQKHEVPNKNRLAERFFSPQEIDALRECGEEREVLFYRLWTRKEAYGKLTGEGVVSVMGKNVLPGAEYEGGHKPVWEEHGDVEGYSLAICRYADSVTAV